MNLELDVSPWIPAQGEEASSYLDGSQKSESIPEDPALPNASRHVANTSLADSIRVNRESFMTQNSRYNK